MKDKLSEIMNRFSVTTLCAFVLLGANASRGLEKAAPPDGGGADTNVTATARRDAETASAAAELAPNAVTEPAALKRSRGIRRGSSSREIIEFGRPAELKAGETANDVVVIGSSAIVHGKVNDAVVAIGGNVVLDGEVSGDVVAVLGNVMLGTNASVRGNVVAVGGNVKMEPEVKVHGDAVAVGGRVDRPDSATIDGQIMSVNLPGLGWLSGMSKWVTECVFKLRPLAPGVAWVWVVAGLFLLLYLLVALAFPRPVQACVDEIARRPATTLLIGLMTKMLAPIVTIILIATGIGVLVVPFLFAAILFAGILGKVALLAYFGRRLGQQFGLAALQQLLMAFLIGWIILTVLYLVPVIGMAVYGVTGVWALGAAVMAMFDGMRREQSQPGGPPSSTPLGGIVPPHGGFTPMPMPATAPAAIPPGVTPPVAGLAPASPERGGFSSAPPVIGSTPAPGPATVPPEAWRLPRAEFWERMAAAFLDLVVVGVVRGLLHGGGPAFLLVALAYFAGMWAWKGTTLGGIVMRLKVVRLDGQPVTFAVALVRGLSAALSVVVLFLGFLWIAWDRDKQGWHDKIAGTVVVRLPHTQSLVCY